MSIESVKNTILWVVLLISCITDIRHNIVKNIVTYPCILVALVLSIITFDGVIVKDTLSALLIPFVTLLPLYLLGILGAGDIKLLCAIGALMGSDFLLQCMIHSIAVGGVFSVIIMIYRGNLFERLRYLLEYLTAVLLYFYLAPYSENKKSNGKLPLATIVTIGVIVTKINYS